MASKLKDKFNQAILYYRSTEAVSKPIAYLMLFFSLAFISSIMVGLFLVGKWGYRKVVPLDEPTVVTAPASTGDAGKETTKTTDLSSGSAVQNTAIESPDSTSKTAQNIKSDTLPDTGGNFIGGFIAVFVASYLLSRLYYQKTK